MFDQLLVHSFLTVSSGVFLCFVFFLGSLCSSYSTRRYQLPVMDSLFVRKCQRGKGFGLQMLKDFVLSFKEDNLGLRYPLTKSMYKGTWVHPAAPPHWLISHSQQCLCCCFIEPKAADHCKFNALLFVPSVWEVPVSVPRRHRPAVGGREYRWAQPEDQYLQQDPGHGSER